jgi:paraquat-inducible protein A
MQIGGRRFLLSLAIVGASVCLALGVSQPIIRLTKYVFWSTEHSLISTVAVLIKDGQLFLGLTVLVFSIVLPVLKLLYLLLVSTLSQHEILHRRGRLRALEWLGKWSMHDVLVLALTIFFIKSQGVYDAASLSGVYFFTAAVVLMILAYAWLRTDPPLGAHEIGPPAPAGEAAGGTVIALPAPMPPVLPTPDGPATADEAPDEPAAASRLSTLRNFVLSSFIILATISFALGIIMPAIRFTTAYVYNREHSIASITWALYQNQEHFLCAVLFLFSILFPLLKLVYLLTLVISPEMSPEFRTRSISVMEWLGRYSMTDVMVLALMIFYMNSSGYTEATVLPGVYYFAAAAIMTMIAYGWANTVPSAGRQARRRERTMQKAA